MVIHCYNVHKLRTAGRTFILKVESVILSLFTFVPGTLALNALWQNRYNKVLLTNYIGNGCFSEARRGLRWFEYPDR